MGLRGFCPKSVKFLNISIFSSIYEFISTIYEFLTKRKRCGTVGLVREAHNLKVGSSSLLIALLIFFFLSIDFFKRKSFITKVRGGLQESIDFSTDTKNNYQIKTIKNSSVRSRSATKSNISDFNSPISSLDQFEWSKIPNRHSPNFIMSDGSYGSPTQKYLDSRSSSSPSRSPKTTKNSTSASPIADETEIVKSSSQFKNGPSKFRNINGNNNAFSPISNLNFSSNASSSYRPANYSSSSSPLQNITTSNLKERSNPSSPPSGNLGNSWSKLSSNSKNQTKSYKFSPNKLSENDSDSSEIAFSTKKSKTISPIKNRNYQFNQNESESDIFDVKLTDAETKLSMRFSKQVSSLGSPDNQNNIGILSDSDSASSTSNFDPKQSQKKYSFNNRNITKPNASSSLLSTNNDKLVLLSESETNESDQSQNEFDNQVISYMNQLKYLSSSDLETSSTSSANVQKRRNVAQKRNAKNALLPSVSDSELSSEISTDQNHFVSSKATANTKIVFNMNSDSEMISEDSSNRNFNGSANQNRFFTSNVSYNTKTNININSDSDITSEDSSNQKFPNSATNRTSSFTPRSNYIAKIDLNSEDSSTSDFKPPTNRYSPKANYSQREDLDSDSENFSKQKSSNDLDLKFNYDNVSRKTPVRRDLDQSQDMSSSDAFIQTPKFPIPSKKESQMMQSDSSSEVEPNINSNFRNTFSSSNMQKNRYSTPRNNFGGLNSQNTIDRKTTNYGFKNSVDRSSNNNQFSTNRTPQASNRRLYTSSLNSNQRNSFKSNSSKMNMNKVNDMDSDDELLASLQETIRANETLLNSLGHLT